MTNLTDALNQVCEAPASDSLDKLIHIGLVYGMVLLYGGTEQYDMSRSHPHNETLMEAFLALPEVRDGLHVIPSTNWTSQNVAVFLSLFLDMSTAMTDKYTLILEGLPQVMLYQGLFDPIFTRHGEELFSLSLPWPGASSFASAPRDHVRLCAPDAFGVEVCNVVGYMKNYKNLAWFEIRDAGHLVPQDQPAPAFEMIQRYMNWNFTTNL